MKLRFGNTLLVTAAGLALLAGSALAQSADPAQPATRSISVVGTATADGQKTAGADKTAELSKDTPASDTAKLPPIPSELSTGTDAAKDKASVVLTPAPAADAVKDAAAVPPAADAGKVKEKVVATPVPNGEAGKDKAVVSPPPPKVVVRPKTADVEVVPNIKPHRGHDHYGRYSAEFAHPSYGDHCQHFGY